MLSKRQIMQIAFAVNNPALVQRLFKDYRARQPKPEVEPEPLKKHLPCGLAAYLHSRRCHFSHHNCA